MYDRTIFTYTVFRDIEMLKTRRETPKDRLVKKTQKVCLKKIIKKRQAKKKTLPYWYFRQLYNDATFVLYDTFSFELLQKLQFSLLKWREQDQIKKKLLKNF